MRRSGIGLQFLGNRLVGENKKNNNTGISTIMEVAFEDGSGYLLARLSGRYSLRGMMQVIDQIADESAKRKIRRILVDVSIDGDAPAAERYAYAEHAARLLRGIEKFAAACSEPERRASIRFTEDVARNRGLPLRVFPELAAAIRWLADPAVS